MTELLTRAADSNEELQSTVSLSWDKLEYTVDVEGKPKNIIRGMTGTAMPLRLLAIMGGSGAGKTTLLNLLSDRLLVDASHRVTGHVLLNRTPIADEFRKVTAFVTQDDVVFDMATPQETLRFSARVRRGLTEKESDEQVELALHELGLTDVRNTVIGVPGLIRGLSGGERKRTNIGVELMTEPKVLLLDEPTSGLDSVTAERVVGLLRDIARRGRTVIVTIHQPSADVVALFDDLLLMADGKAIYHGRAIDAVDYFKGHGFECPETYTPTDYFMMLMQSADTKPTLIANWEKHLETCKLGVPWTAQLDSRTMCVLDSRGKCVDQDPILQKFIAIQGGSAWVQFSEL